VRNNLTQRIVKQQKQFIIILIAAALLLLVLLFVAYRNFAQKNRANQRIQTLLREVHHRIKNNLQMLVGLFNLQIESLGDEAAKQTLRENEARLTSMNLIHNSLYQHHDTNEIEMSAYVKKLLAHIKESFKTDGVTIALITNVEEIMLEADKAVAIGLIINELATNSLKYAFNGNSGTISLDMHLVNKTSLSLSLADNGKGLPPASANNSTSFGLKLVSLMVKQLGAAISVQSNRGTSYQISIPL
jgi:two-component sensor histidine kinase